MQLRAAELSRALERELAPCYLLAGDELFQRGEAADAVRARALSSGCQERLVFAADRDLDWTMILADAASPSLFAEQRLIEIRLNSARPGKDGGAALAQLAGLSGPDVILVTSPRLDGSAKRSAWYKSMSAQAVCVEFWPVGPGELPGWIQTRFAGHGVTATAEAATLLAERTEGNLVAAAQSTALLALLAAQGTVDVDAVMHASGEGARYDGFALVDAMLEGHTGRTVRIVRALAREKAPLPPLVGTLAWMLRAVAGIATRLHAGEAAASVFGDRSLGVWRQRRAIVQAAVRRHPQTAWYGFLRQAHHIDRAGKGMSPDDPWALIELLCLRVAGAAVLVDGVRR
ncbi:MAG: DNA polymerase III subunit delta [Pseudomonadota bacterium]